MTLYLLFAALLFPALLFLLWPLKHDKRRFTLMALLIGGGSVALYLWVGAPHILPLLEKREARLEELKRSITLHSGRVKENADNLESWVALGDNFMETGQFDAAANAYKRSVLLSKGNPLLILAYARAMIVEADGKVSDHAKKSLEMVLMQQPDNPEARYFLTVRKLQDGDAETAMQEMKALYSTLPEGSPLKSMIDRQIGRN